jgi:Tol biopolymer transport system component
VFRPTPLRGACLAAAVLLLLGAAAALAGPRTFPSANGRIAFDTGFGGHIWAVDANGKNLRHLTSGAGSDIWPDLSPDGRKVAYSHCNGNFCALTVADANGRHAKQLTPSGNVFNGEPDWSPDGKRIAFTSSRTGQDEIWIANADGSAATKLTNVQPSGWDANHSAWSPDGKRLLFVNHRWDTKGTKGDGCAAGEVNATDVWIVDADGSGAHAVTGGPNCELEPDWSPDGTKILWIEASSLDQRSASSRVMVAKPDGTGVHAVVDDGSNPWHAVFSPDGTKILFDTPGVQGVKTVPVGGGAATVAIDQVAGRLDWSRPTPAGVLLPLCTKRRHSTAKRPCYG